MLNKTLLAQVLKECGDAFLNDLKEIETRLLVDLKLDLDIEFRNDVPFVRPESSLAGLDLRLLNTTVDAMFEDGVQGAGKFVISDAIGDVIGKPLTRGSSTFNRVAVDVGIGRFVDPALDQAVEAMGKNLRNDVKRRVAATLEEMCTNVIDGESHYKEVHQKLLDTSLLHPDPEIRDLCQRTMKPFEQQNRLGLKHRLLSAGATHAIPLFIAASRHVLGVEGFAAEFPELVGTPKFLLRREEILKIAQRYNLGGDQ